MHTEAPLFFFFSYLWGSGAAEEEEKAAAAPVTRLGMAGQEELTAFVSRKASILLYILLYIRVRMPLHARNSPPLSLGKPLLMRD